jgi:DNA-directed RNA polymerase specialized sigma24 family protein
MSKMKERNKHLLDAADVPEDMLISLMKAGETKAYRYFFWEYADYVNMLTHSLLASPEDAQSVVQQIMRDVWTKRKTSWLKAPLKPFLYREVYRQCQPFLRGTKRPSRFARLFRL